MRNTQQFSITLPHEMARVVQEKVASGAYASVSEVLRDGVRALMDRDLALERWLREEVVPGHAEYRRDPAKAVDADDLLDRLRARRIAEVEAPTIKDERAKD